MAESRTPEDVLTDLPPPHYGQPGGWDRNYARRAVEALHDAGYEIVGRDASTSTVHDTEESERPTPQQSGPPRFGTPEVGYAMPADGSTTWPE